MPVPDLQGPYDEFVERLNDIRRTVCAVESSFRQPKALTTARPKVDLSTVGPTTVNNTNAMAMVFLASTYEEFVREELSECARLLCTKYSTFPDEMRHSVRNSYWVSSLQRLGYAKGILTKGNPRALDVAMLASIKPIIEVAQLFVINDDPSKIDPATTVHHRNNFRPRVVDEIAQRIGIGRLTARSADNVRIRAYFGVAASSEAVRLLQAKLDEFYDRRNEIVHSLNSTTGYGVDYVLDWIDLFEAVADSMKDVLARSVAKW